jgi:D-xylose 1-dehydrogenase (NADP+, D-xylono-1,5-lactone-forming)
MSGQDLRWGFLGASRIGRRVLAPAIAAAPGHALHAVAARDLARARAFADEFGAPRAHEGYAALIDDPGIDLVYNALPNDAHLPWTVRALEAGKHVLCEKPLAMNADEVAAMQAAEARTGRCVLEAFSYRFHPQIDRLAAILAEGRIGRIIAAHSSYMSTMEPEDFRWHAALGGGALYDLGCYCVSILRRVAGREPERVAAIVERQRGVDASTMGMLDFGDSLAAQFSCSFVASLSQYLTVYGATGWVTLERPFSSRDRELRLVLDGEAEIFPPTNPYQRMVEHMGDVARGAAALRFPLSDALGQARTLDALFRSAATGEIEPVAR